jgi:transposase InsO family protein
MRVVGQPYWRLRDHLRATPVRRKRQESLAVDREQVKDVALAHPTYGYRPVHQVLKAQGEQIGRERVRYLLKDLGLGQHRPKKTRRPAPKVTESVDYPEGRRVQIDATRLSLADGVAWIYLVEDVLSRACLSVSVGRRLSQERAAVALEAGHHVLHERGITEPLVIQSDAGADFTSAYFQTCCQEIGQWIRCRVNQVGGMGILERLNRTFKYEFVFRHEVEVLDDLKRLGPQFQQWYNQERLHSSLGYEVPWQQLTAEAAVLS